MSLADDFSRRHIRTAGLTWFVTVCQLCGETFCSCLLTRMPEWETSHTLTCPALTLEEST